MSEYRTAALNYACAVAWLDGQIEAALQADDPLAQLLSTPWRLCNGTGMAFSTKMRDEGTACIWSERERFGKRRQGDADLVTTPRALAVEILRRHGVRTAPVSKYLLLEGDAGKLLAEFDAKRVQCVVTSPPYWKMRDYAAARQLGNETLVDCLKWASGLPHHVCGECYVCRLRAVFFELKRILKDDGTIWLNVGDRHISKQSNKAHTGAMASRAVNKAAISNSNTKGCGIADKNLALVPERIALALQSDGWFIRQRNIWAKQTWQHQSVKDRPTTSHEHVWLISKSAQYFYDQEAALQDAVSPDTYRPDGRRNMRDVWDDITPSPKDYDHKAIMPNALALRCIAAGSKPGDIVLDPFSGMATTGIAALQLERKYVGLEINPTTLNESKFRLDRYLASGRLEEPTWAEYQNLPFGQPRIWEGTLP